MKRSIGSRLRLAAGCAGITLAVGALIWPHLPRIGSSVSAQPSAESAAMRIVAQQYSQVDGQSLLSAITDVWVKQTTWGQWAPLAVYLDPCHLTYGEYLEGMAHLVPPTSTGTGCHAITETAPAPSTDVYVVVQAGTVNFPDLPAPGRDRWVAQVRSVGAGTLLNVRVDPGTAFPPWWNALSGSSVVEPGRGG